MSKLQTLISGERSVVSQNGKGLFNFFLHILSCLVLFNDFFKTYLGKIVSLSEFLLTLSWLVLHECSSIFGVS